MADSIELQSDVEVMIDYLNEMGEILRKGGGVFQVSTIKNTPGFVRKGLGA